MLCQDQESLCFIRKPYISFDIKALIKRTPILFQLLILNLFKKIKYIHYSSTPSRVFGILLSKLFRRSLVFDSKESNTESMAENHNCSAESKAFKIIFKFEKWMTKSAYHFTGTSDGMFHYGIDRSLEEISDFSVKQVCVIIYHGINGFFSEKKDQWKKYLILLIENSKKRKTLGKNSRKNILGHYHLKAFD